MEIKEIDCFDVNLQQYTLAVPLIHLQLLLLVTTTTTTKHTVEANFMDMVFTCKCAKVLYALSSRFKSKLSRAQTFLRCGAEQGSVTTEMTLIELVTAQKGAAGVKVCRGGGRRRQVSRPVWHRPKARRGIDYTATGKFGLDCDWGMTPLTCPDQCMTKVSKSQSNIKLTFDNTSLNNLFFFLCCLSFSVQQV